MPMERVKRVDRPTTVLTETIERIDMRDTAYGLAARLVARQATIEPER